MNTKTPIERITLGYPLGASFVNDFFSLYKDILLNNCPLECKRRTYRRCVNDTFFILENAEHSENFKDYLDSQYVSIKFSSEIEI